MLARLRRQVGMQNELTGVYAELLSRRKQGGILGARREVDCCDIETLHLDHSQPRWDQGFVRGCVGVDVQSISHAKVKIYLGGVARRNAYLFRVKELHRCGRITSLIGTAGQRQRLVFYYLPGSGKRNKPGENYCGEAEHAICLQQPMLS